MRTDQKRSDPNSIVGSGTLHALGVLVPIRFQPVKVVPGRHHLGRSGTGMRLLRTRPFVPGEDNPRDIDKFSPPGEPHVVEWEDEAQSAIMVLVDDSASMLPSTKLALRNACLIQLTYSLWRAGDRVSTTLFDTTLRDEVRSANLRTQMARITTELAHAPELRSTCLATVLEQYLRRNSGQRCQLVFIISDFLSANWDARKAEAKWHRLLKRFQGNIVPIVTSYSIPEEADGVMKIWDPERRSRRLVRFSINRVRTMNLKERARVHDLTRLFRSSGLDYIVLTHQRQIYSELARLARIRRQRRF